MPVVSVKAARGAKKWILAKKIISELMSYQIRGHSQITFTRRGR